MSAMDEKTAWDGAVAGTASADYHQRGRRRRRSPPPVPLSLAMTPQSQVQTQNRPYHPPRTRHNPRPRQQTPSGSSTFRGRRRHRSPSVGTTATTSLTAALRKASRSSRPHTRSSSVASSMQMQPSRPTSPHEWWPASTCASGGGWLRSVSRSRGRQCRRGGNVGSAMKRGVDSPSPRRKAYRIPLSEEHSLAHYHNMQHHSHYLQPRSYKPVSRRSHCPSRSGSAEGYHEDVSLPTTDPIALAARRRRRRQRTQSRPRPRRMMSGDSNQGGGSGLYDGYFTFDNDGPTSHPQTGDNHNPGDTNAGPSRVQFQMLLADSSDTTSDGDAMDVEMG